jgi:acyl-CoA thioester hydrolase
MMTGDWIEMARGTVRAWHCDHLGHMNVQFYISKLVDAGMLVINGLGLTWKDAEERHINGASVNHNINYRRELLAGDLVAVESRVADVSGKKVLIEHRLRNVATGEIALDAKVLYVMIDLKTRKSVEAPTGLPPIPPLPAGLPPLPTERSTIPPWECDVMGHLNIQFYMARATDADAHVAFALGVPPPRLRADHGGLTPAAHRLLFRRELRQGASTLVRSGVRGVAGDEVLWHHDLRDAELGHQAAVIETRARYANMETGAPLPLPQAVREKALQLAADWKNPPPLPPANEPAMPAEPPTVCQETYRGVFESWELDQFGLPAPQFYMPRFINAAQIMNNGYGWPLRSRLSRGWGSAALDYDIRYHARPVDGDTLIAYSGYIALGSKAHRFGHYFTSADSGDVVVTADVTTVWFDLTARKAVVLPDEFRAVVEPNLMLPAE